MRAEVTDPKDDAASKHNTRRASGARREASERVVLRRADVTIDGWTLNLSRGGVRVVVEEPLVEGDEVEVQVGDGSTFRPGRVVWINEQADGQIVGVQFLDGDGSLPPPPVA